MAQSEPHVIVFLVGNKKDMEDKREVTLERVEAFKRERGIIFSFETSAKTGENIESLFITASKILYNNFKDKIAQMKDEAIKKRKGKKLKGSQNGNGGESLSSGSGKKKSKC